MTFLLDTNVISEMRRPERADRRVRDWFSRQVSDDLFCSSISILELELGMLRALRRDRRQGIMLQQWLQEQVLPSFAGRILAFGTEAALTCAALHVPNPRPERDAWIGATALVHRLTMVTRNARDFVPMGVTVLNPWED